MTTGSNLNITWKTFQDLLSSNPDEVNRAVTQLYDHYYPMVCSYLRKHGFEEPDIEDAFQEGILAFLRTLKAGKVKKDANPGGYFFTICKHAGLKIGKESARLPIAEFDTGMLENIPDDEGFAETDFERNQLRLKVWDLLNSLGNPCASLLKRSLAGKEKIVDFYPELGYKNAQVARTAKYKCLQRLKKKLELDPYAKQLINKLFP